jgi:cell division protein FtsB
VSSTPRLRGRAARFARLFPATEGRAARTPFVLLVVLLLGGGLICLLVLNSALSAGSFRLDDLQRETKNLTDEEQALQRDVDAYSAPDALQRRARELGMVPGGDPAFLGPDGKVEGVPSPAAPSGVLARPDTGEPAARPLDLRSSGILGPARDTLPRTDPGITPSPQPTAPATPATTPAGDGSG